MRKLTFELGQLNIITGSSRRGKSAIVTIIDYCLGSSGYPVKAGVTRDHSRGFGLVIVSGGRTMYVARPAPERLRKTADRMYVGIISDPESIPAFDTLEFNTNVDTARQIIGDLCGIDRSLRLPMPGTAGPLHPGIRHALFFVIQEQNEIANQDVLFHTQGDEHRPNAIRAAIPYFLGAVDTEYATLTIRLRTLKRELVALRRSLDEQAIALGASGQARALLAEAAAVGLIDQLPPQGINESEAVSILRPLTDADVRAAGLPEIQGDRLGELNQQRAQLRDRIAGLNVRLTRLRRAADENGEFASEASEQRARLASLGFFGNAEGPSRGCPMCGTDTPDAPGIWVELRSELLRLDGEIVAIRTDTPRIDQMIAQLAEEIQGVTQQLRANRAEIDELEAGLQAVARLRAAESRAALIQGRIGFYLELLDRRSHEAPIQDRTVELETAIADIEARLEESGNPDLLASFLARINQNLWDKARHLELEHSASPIRLDLRQLTVVADTHAGAVPLYEMGSGENYVGYHVATFLALHEWFATENRPVPRTLIMDQPSQVWFPADYAGDGSHVLPDDDRESLVRIYQSVLATLARPDVDLQVIVMEHADLEEQWFSDAVRYRWRAEGEALIPADWVEEL
ncbi:DUF3732 domain-containing protein [Nonomuraea soli]|uniref:Prefoldin subunit 5 n=1 Tax=Nonomuraea soli TaxID=1032476 RepID=A0A7W0HVB5_9ACTN|nr:DUF3732 domain-containing protein [Nonomuraea soli]MBA2896636.1 prefoldin subunit 5 [Nonomuraea soli]